MTDREYMIWKAKSDSKYYGTLVLIGIGVMVVTYILYEKGII